VDLAVHLLFADTPGNELGGLGTKIKDEDFFHDKRRLKVKIES
jgi:hypothetical protein